MDEARMLAEQSLESTVELWAQTGLTESFAALVAEVWQANLARHEPDELADNARTLGFNCSENLVGRAERRILGDQNEVVQWSVPGLTVARPHGSFRMDLASRRHFVMKAPMAYGRRPQWDCMVTWDSESTTRLSVAQRNTQALGGYRTSGPGQDGLFPIFVDGSIKPVANFMLVWAGDMTAPVTAGWLTVPALGEVPFAAVRQLWWDDEGQRPDAARRRGPEGPSFDQRSASTPAIALKPQSGEAGQA